MEKSLKLKKDLWWVGALDPDLRVFDVIMRTEYGTSYNAYLIKGSEKNCLVETVKDKFFDEYLDKIKENIDLSNIDYIVINHTEPDHSGSLVKLLSLCPNITVVASKVAIDFLKQIVHQAFQYIEAEMSISLGDKTLEFISAPLLHWPDTMFTYVKEMKTLFSCDSFGCHYSHAKVTNEEVTKDLEDAYSYYFNMIMGPFRKEVLSALDKIQDLEIETICNGHGPVITKNPKKYIELYRKYSTLEQKEPNVVIPFVSAHGYTKTLASKIAEGIASCNIPVKTFDLVYFDPAEVRKAMDGATGILFGSPTMIGDALPPVLDLVNTLNPIINDGLFAGCFGSYGWSGEATPNMQERLKQLRLNLPLEPFKVRLRPSEEDLKKAFSYGVDFADAMLGKAKKKMWVCSVCKQKFEGENPPEVCPICGAPASAFHLEEIALQTQEIKNAKPTKEKFVIIGGGGSGFEAIKTIRERDKDSSITLLCKEAFLPYNRPQINDFVLEEVKPEHFYIAEEKWYKTNGVELIFDEAIRIDEKNRQVETQNGERIEYTKLLIATGSNNFIPLPDALSIEGVFTIRNLEDSKSVFEYIRDKKKIAVIGGGLLGLEVADFLVDKSKMVSVVEAANRLLPIQLDLESSEIFYKKLANLGISILLDHQLTKIERSREKLILNFKNGDELEADAVIFSVGVRAEKKLAEDAGIKTNLGIVVNEYLQTSSPNIYAAGDCAEIDGRILAIWSNALKTGRTAGLNMLGIQTQHQKEVPGIFLSAFGAYIFSAGMITPKEEKNLKVFSKNDGENRMKLIFQDEVLIGGLLIKDTSKSSQIIKAIEEELRYDKVEETFK